MNAKHKAVREDVFGYFYRSRASLKKNGNIIQTQEVHLALLNEISWPET